MGNNSTGSHNAEQHNDKFLFFSVSYDIVTKVLYFDAMKFSEWLIEVIVRNVPINMGL